MATIAKKYRDNLERIKNQISEAYEYFQPNYRRWQEFHKFVFLTALNEKDKE